MNSGVKAFIPYITAGDPSLQATAAHIRALAEGGADIIELGMPFSDPVADGPVIQAASERALENGTDLSGILKMTGEVSKKVSIPLVLMGYFNPILSYGVERFARDASRSGIDGCLIADLPFEESQEVEEPFNKHGIDRIFLISPTSGEARIKKIASAASGYLYYVSVTGTTGSRLTGIEGIEKNVQAIMRMTSIPVAVGFGIKTPAEARIVSQFADGVVVGSVFVRKIGDGAEPGEIEALAAKFKKAVTSIRR